jgi:hypothetical protein
MQRRCLKRQSAQIPFVINICRFCESTCEHVRCCERVPWVLYLYVEGPRGGGREKRKGTELFLAFIINREMKDICLWCIESVYRRSKVQTTARQLRVHGLACTERLQGQGSSCQRA